MPLNKYLGGIQAIQLIYFQSNCNIQSPSNIFHFLRIIGSVVNFDILEPEWTTEQFFDFQFEKALGEMQGELEEKSVLNQNMQENGYETFDTMQNIGGVFIVLVLVPVLMVVCGLLKLFLGIYRYSKKLERRK